MHADPTVIYTYIHSLALPGALPSLSLRRLEACRTARETGQFFIQRVSMQGVSIPPTAPTARAGARAEGRTADPLPDLVAERLQERPMGAIAFRGEGDRKRKRLNSSQ